MGDHDQDRSIPGVIEYERCVKKIMDRTNQSGVSKYRERTELCTRSRKKSAQHSKRQDTNLVNALEGHWYYELLKTVVGPKIEEGRISNKIA
jgi:hypothetical protein